MVPNDETPWDEILASTMFVLRTTVHTTTQYTPKQLVFRWDSISNICLKTNWRFIKKRKTLSIKRNEQKNVIKRDTHTTRGTKSCWKIYME